jgi:4'-phosphopantetheinyl transferase
MIDEFSDELTLFRRLFPTASSCSMAAVAIDEAQGLEIAPLWLSPEEQEFHRRLPTSKRGPEWLAGRQAAKMAIIRLLGLSLPEFQKKISIMPRADGRPQVRLPALHGAVEISISHSGNLAAALAAFLPCGLDVQELRTAAVRVREYFSSPSELGILQRVLSLPDLECLNLLWSAKEALRKMVACEPLAGFRELQLIGGSPAGPRQALLHFLLERSATTSFNVAVFLRPGFAWALTIHHPENKKVT